MFKINEWKLRLISIVSFCLAGYILNAQEICGNGSDDDNDGLIDCYDPDCSGDISCDGFYFGNSLPGCQSTPAPGEPFTLTKVWDTDAAQYPMDSRQTVLVGDINNDGATEVIGIDDNPGKIYAFDGKDGSLVMEISTSRQDFQTNAPAFADVDGDGFAEFFIVVQNGGSPRLVRYDPDGAATLSTATWTSSSAVGHGGNNDDRYTPELADFDEDGVPEVYMADQIFDAATGTRIISGSGSRGEETGGEPFSVAADVLPDAFCADCSGLELVTGNEVYSVNLSTASFTLQVSAPGTLSGGITTLDGVTSIADWDQDGDLDAIVNQGRYVYAWDIQTSVQIGSTFDMRSASQSNTTGNGGHANIADFDSDGRPEIGLAGRNVYVVIDDNVSGMGELWSVFSTDNSQRTGSTVYDFHADGFYEVIYRDEDSLYVYNGLDGSVMASIACGAGTRMEYPVVADVDDNGQSEVVCACQDVPGPSNSGNDYISMFRSTDYPWVSARKVWNQHNYFEVNVNDDLTIPAVLQDHALVPGSNNFLAQSTFRLSNGSPTLAAPDATVTISSPIDFTSCGPPPYQIDATVDISNGGSWPLSSNTPVAFYNGDPYGGSATLMAVVEIGVEVAAGGNITRTYTLPEQHQDFDLYVLINHNGESLPPTAPDYVETFVGECDYSNNLFGPLMVADCQSPPIVDDATILLDENSPNGTSVHTVSATDPDIGASLTYAITAGNTNNAFAIDTGTGEITVNDVNQLDFSIQTFTLTVTVTDNDGLTDTATITINIDDESEYTVNPSQNVDSYSNNDVLAIVTDGNGLITAAVLASGSLPAGTSLNALTGQITVSNAGALVAGTTSFDVTTTDAGGGTTTQTVTVVTDPDTEAIYSVNSAQNVDSYTTNDVLATVSDANGAITSATIASGSLPPGTSLNTTSGAITVSDASSLVGGTTNVDITTTDVTGGITTQTVTLVINPDNESVYTVNAAQNVDSYSDSDVLATVADTDGAITSTVLSSGSLPAGTTLNATTGAITVSDAGLLVAGTTSFDVTTVDAIGGVTTQTVTIVIDPDAEATYTVNASQNLDSYSDSDVLATVADTDGAITSAVLVSGSLPAGTTLNATTGAITVSDASLLTVGSTSFDVTTTDATGGVTTQTVTIVIDPDAEATYTVNAAQNIDSYSNSDVLATVADTDGAITSAVLASGSLPAGTTLNATTGAITINDASLLVAGTTNFDITTTDAAGGTTTQTVTIVIGPDSEAAYTVNAAQNVDSYSDSDVLATVADTDGAITSAVLASGSLPAGTTLNAITGAITVSDASLLTVGSTSFDVTTTDTTGGITTQTVTIMIDPDAEAIYTVNAAQNVDSYSNSDVLATVSDADGAITNAVVSSGSLPPGVTINASTGEITVSDASLLTAGSTSFDVTTTDAEGGVTTQTVTIVIGPDVEAVYSVSPVQNVDSYSINDVLATVTDTDAAITSAVITSGTLPPGTVINAATGEITVNDASILVGGTTNIDITTTDANGGVTTQTVALVLGPDSEAAYTVNASKNVESYTDNDVLATVNDADGAITSAIVSSGTLPAGTMINSTTGEIIVSDASLLVAGSTSIDITTMDVTGGITTQTVTLIIDPDVDAVYTANAAQNIDNYMDNDVLATVNDTNGAVTSATVSSGTLPAGTAINAATGEITVSDASALMDGSISFDVTTVDATGGTRLRLLSSQYYRITRLSIP